MPARIPLPVDEIATAIQRGEPQKSLAARYKVAPSTMSKFIRRHQIGRQQGPSPLHKCLLCERPTKAADRYCRLCSNTMTPGPLEYDHGLYGGAWVNDHGVQRWVVDERWSA